MSIKGIVLDGIGVNIAELITRGLASAAVSTVSGGLEFAAPISRLDYTLPNGVLDYTLRNENA